MRRTKTGTVLALAFGVAGCSASSGPPPTSCPESVTFRLEAPEGSKWYSYMSDDTVALDWISVTTSAGVAVRIQLYADDPNEGQYCGEADGFIGFSGGTVSSPIPRGGTSQTWNGLYYAPGDDCVTATCATPGQYVAKMCACPSELGCIDGTSTFTCVSVPFEYPASAPVVGTLPKR